MAQPQYAFVTRSWDTDPKLQGGYRREQFLNIWLILFI